jgi:hypothetical protein
MEKLGKDVFRKFKDLVTVQEMVVEPGANHFKRGLSKVRHTVMISKSTQIHAILEVEVAVNQIEFLAIVFYIIEYKKVCDSHHIISVHGSNLNISSIKKIKNQFE